MRKSTTPKKLTIPATMAVVVLGAVASCSSTIVEVADAGGGGSGGTGGTGSTAGSTAMSSSATLGFDA